MKLWVSSFTYPSIDHHNDDVISAIDQGITWLHNNGYIREAVGQPSDFYQITNTGIDLIGLRRSSERDIDGLIEFVTRKSSLPHYEVTDVDVLGLFVKGMERTGKNEEQFRLTIDERLAVNISRSINKNVSVELLKKATDVCKSRRWLKIKYGGGANTGIYVLPLKGYITMRPTRSQRCQNSRKPRLQRRAMLV